MYTYRLTLCYDGSRYNGWQKQGNTKNNIGAMELTVASPRFHARLNATGKTYVYRIWNSDAPNVFERKYMYTMPDTLDISAMEAAAAHLIGTHNFMSFCANKRMKKSTVRTITDLRIDRLGHEVRFTVTGDGFLYNMVRILVGTLLEVGTGKRAADSIPALLDAADRSQAGYLVPPHGLRLEAVYYD